MHDELIYAAGAAVFTSHFLEFIKGLKWFPWMSHLTPNTNRVIGVACAWATGVGFEFHHDAWSLAGGGDITIHMPMLSVAVQSLLHATSQWGMQQAWYLAIVKQQAVGVPQPNPTQAQEK